VIARLQAEIAQERRIALAKFDAAEKSRTTTDWDAKLESADARILADYATIAARARAAVQNDWSASSLVDGHVRHVVGTGITAKCNVRHIDTAQPLQDFNERADWLWEQWGRTPAWCDQERRKTLLDMEALAVRELVTVGESFTILNYAPRQGMVGLTLQMFEPEQLDVSKYTAPNGNEIKRGIEIDDFGAAVAYWVYLKKHPLEGGYVPGGRAVTQSERVPQERVLHLMRQERVRQTHGVTRMISVLREMWHTKMFEEYTLLRARFEACGGATIETELGSGNADLYGLLAAPGTLNQDTDTSGNKKMRFEPNMVWELPPGKKANFHAPQTPGGQHVPYTQQQVKKIAAGGGLDYPTVSRDFSGNTFAGQRQGMIESWMETDPEQLRLINCWLRPIHDAFITWAIKEGRLSAPGFNSGDDWHAMYLEAEYQPPEKPWIDPANQAAAAKLMLEQRLQTRKQIMGSLGIDLRDVFRELHDEQELAKSLGIVLPETQPQKPAQSPVEPKPGMAPDGFDAQERSERELKELEDAIR
jgi:lambda family phage portal protein